MNFEIKKSRVKTVYYDFENFLKNVVKSKDEDGKLAIGIGLKYKVLYPRNQQEDSQDKTKEAKVEFLLFSGEDEIDILDEFDLRNDNYLFVLNYEYILDYNYLSKNTIDSVELDDKLVNFCRKSFNDEAEKFVKFIGLNVPISDVILSESK